MTQSTENYSYNNMNQLLSAGNTTYTYDANGNMLTKTTNSQTTNYGWDGLWHLP